jgi:hypothetical protein
MWMINILPPSIWNGNSHTFKAAIKVLFDTILPRHLSSVSFVGLDIIRCYRVKSHYDTLNAPLD